MRILYVEDHTRFRALVIREFLTEYEVTCASTLAEARRLLVSGEYDVVLLDQDLPDGKGVELLADSRDLTLPERIVAVSSREEGNARLLEAGATAAVSKLEFGQLPALLAHWVEEGLSG